MRRFVLGAAFESFAKANAEAQRLSDLARKPAANLSAAELVVNRAAIESLQDFKTRPQDARTNDTISDKLEARCYAFFYVETVDLGSGVFVYCVCLKQGMAKSASNIHQRFDKHTRCFCAVCRAHSCLGSVVAGAGGARSLFVGECVWQFEELMKNYAGSVAHRPAVDCCAFSTCGNHSESVEFGHRAASDHDVSLEVYARAVANFGGQLLPLALERVNAERLKIASAAAARLRHVAGRQ